jgi:predicted double-glycine peptidase
MKIQLRAAIAALVLLPATGAGQGRWLDVPFVRQEKNGCGAASLAMILAYWSPSDGAIGSRAHSIQQELYVPAERGIPASSMQRYLEARDFEAFAFSGVWADLVEHLEKGRPLIVALKPGRTLHYAVVAGVNGDLIALNDPSDRKLRQITRAQFEKSWIAAGWWTLLAVPRKIR